ncbi:MAG: WXG100 family type VII secretion target [Anaerolineae bacterium]|nr:WXG100 family type VII secretion target [Anaerolineae bacterium]
MPSHLFQADGEQLQQIGATFDQLAAEVDEKRANLEAKLAPLRDGGWIGVGADRFFDVMENEILPKLKQLHDYFEQSAQTANTGHKTIEEQFHRVISIAQRGPQ